YMVNSGVREYIERQMASAGGSDAVSLTIRMVKRSRQSDKPYYDVLTVLAQSQSWEVIRTVLEREVIDSGEPGLSIAAELIVESSLVGLVSQEDPYILNIWRRLKEEGHELGWMSPCRTDLERRVGLTRFNVDQPEDEERVDEELLRPCGKVVELENVDIEEPLFNQLRFGLCGRGDEVFGNMEAALFRAKMPIEPSAELGNWIRQHFGPLKGSDSDGASVEGRVVEGAVAVQSIMTLPMHGGAYVPGSGHVYGRFRGWRALGAIVGTPVDASFDAVVEAVEKCIWIEFQPNSEWFFDVAWDCCLGCIREGLKEMFVFAFTDSD
ncbi:MAG: DUF6183 family protein, partial [Verrucomicrobiota bacterium]